LSASDGGGARGALRGRGPAALPAGSDEAVEVPLTFDDNRLASLVFGQYDQNVAHIERRLDVTATALGNHLVIKGPADAVETARRVFQKLYARVRTGGSTLSLGDVDGAIREATAQATLFPAAAIAAEADTPHFEQIATRKRGAVRARNPAQDEYIKLLRTNELVFAEGPAGTGKTWLAVGHAVSLLEQGHAERLILSRPAVEAGERLGFLPGDIMEKLEPYLRPLYDALHDITGADRLQRYRGRGTVEVVPLAYMRGRTVNDAFIVLDEAQNTTPSQMKMALTRMGLGSRMIVTGDVTQSDLPEGQESGLQHAVRLLSGVKGIAVCRLDRSDIVRHDLVQRIVEAYESIGREGHGVT